MRVASDRQYRFQAAPAAVWGSLADVGSYRSWWPWLREFDGQSLRSGDVWRCVVKPPLPYVVRFTIELAEVVEHESVDAELTGDIVGDARIEISSAPAGSEIRLTSDLRPGSRTLRGVGAIAHPLASFGHNWVLDSGARQFGEHALSRREGRSED